MPLARTDRPLQIHESSRFTRPGFDCPIIGEQTHVLRHGLAGPSSRKSFAVWNRDAMTRSRILLISPLLPWPARPNGGAQRTAMILHALRDIGEVDLMVVAPADIQTTEARDDAQWIEPFRVVAQFRAPRPTPSGPWFHVSRFIPGSSGRLARSLAMIEGNYQALPDPTTWLSHQLRNHHYNLIVCRYLRTAMLAGLGNLRSVPRILDIDDVDWHVTESQATAGIWKGWKGRVSARIASFETRRIARRRLGDFDRLWVCSDDDARELSLPNTHVLPNVPYQDPGQEPIHPCPPRPESREILCVGSLGFIRNLEGIDHFINNCWMRVRAQVPDATLRLVGQPPRSEIRDRWQATEGVEVAGFVDDLREAYDRCALTLAPTRWGAGTKIKVIESLAYGRTCLVTPHALHGYGDHLRHGESVWCGPTDDEMVAGCIRLLTDPELRNRMAARGCAIAVAKYSADAFRAIVASTCLPLLMGQETTVGNGAYAPG